MKPSRVSYVRHRFPLIEEFMRRSECLAWFAERFPGRSLVKSACTFCPYHDHAQWAEMKRKDPASFAQAVEIDRAIRPGVPGPRRPKGEAWFLHPSRRPLEDVDFSAPHDRGQPDLFNNECEGMCGV